MVKRTVIAGMAVMALAAGTYAQEQATIVLRSGDKVSGQVVDLNASGFIVRVSGKEQQIGRHEVAVIDFAGSGNVSDADWAKLQSGPGVVLRSGETVPGQLYDIGGTSPLRITLKTPSGERDLSSAEVGRIVLAQPTGTATGASSATGSTPSVPEGKGIAVSGNSQWTPTGVTVRSGDVLRFSTTGEVRLSADASDVAGAAGARSQRKAAGSPLPQNFAGALIARVGNGEPFPIGDQTQVTMPASGQLFLGINDDVVSDNQGGFRVNVQRQGRR